MTKREQWVYDYIKFPLYLLSHPIQGYTRFKEEKQGKMKVAIFYLVLAVIVSILSFKFTGPVMAMYDQSKFNSIEFIVFTALPVFILAVGNWSITTLMNGKGTMKQIFMMGCYSFFPKVFLGLLAVILSNVVTVDEAGFVILLITLSTVLQGYLVFMGLLVIHEYGIVKTVGTVFLTLIATMVILFIALLIFDLSQQIYGFLYSLYYEISTRFF